MKLKLVDTKLEAEETKTFYWEPEKKINYKPGQFYYFTLPKLEYPDTRGATRHFTISSSPTEKGFICFTTRIRKESGFKRTLDELKKGDVIKGEGPEGTFTLDAKENLPQVFLAGGIGITPFRSMLKYLFDIGQNLHVYLIYSNSGPDFVFKKELDFWSNKSALYKIHYLDTGKSGHLNQRFLESIINDWQIDKNNSKWWLTGPPAFVNAIEEVVENMEVPSDNFRSEKFSGY